MKPRKHICLIYKTVFPGYLVIANVLLTQFPIGSLRKKNVSVETRSSFGLILSLKLWSQVM